MIAIDGDLKALFWWLVDEVQIYVEADPRDDAAGLWGQGNNVSAVSSAVRVLTAT